MDENKQWRELFGDVSSKEKAFNMIAERYFDRNFGTMSKGDFETLLFSIYLERCLDSEKPFDDYTLSKQLGITQSRVRSLKINKELKYPRGGKFNWKDDFAESIKYARYDDHKRLVKVSIEDVNVLQELRHFIRTNGWYDEYQLNPRLFQCPLDSFLLLCEKLQGEEVKIDDETQESIKRFAKQKNVDDKTFISKILSGSVEDGLKSLAIEASKEIVTGVLSLIPFGGVAGKAVKYVIDVIGKS